MPWTLEEMTRDIAAENALLNRGDVLITEETVIIEDDYAYEESEEYYESSEYYDD